MKPLILVLSFCIWSISSRADGGYGGYDEGSDTAFLLAVEDAFYVSGSGIVVTGTIESGSVYTGMKVEILGKGDKMHTATVGFISMYTKQIGFAKKGDAVGLNLKGVEKEDVKRGKIIAAPGTLRTYKQLEVSLSLLTDKGSAAKTIENNQSIQVLSRTETVSATVQLTGELVPGETSTVKIKLMEATAFRRGDKIAIKVGEKIIANGTINKFE